MHFDRLRLTGFKSFVDPTDLRIDRGLTGIVGPNGCGKSNLVEALRWVMGENSAKRMRGAEMDDVIFGGTDRRPSRNIAEVVLELDNASRRAPAAFNHFDRLEISRRIERGGGSDFRVNGRSVRARDIQLLFQDSASGATSPALVSQGRVGAIIAAKPSDRRQILEEAAGVTGLHSRRHEAELRLKAAEENLRRLDDVIITMEAQLGTLKKQSRQATRYRLLSERIREAEAILLYLRWRAATADAADARSAYDANEKIVAERMVEAGRAGARQAEAAAALPDLRKAEQAAAAALTRLLVARDTLGEETRRVTQAIAEAERRIGQIEADLHRETALVADAGSAMARLEEEKTGVELARTGEQGEIAAADAAAADARTELDKAEADLARATEASARQEAELSALERRAGDLASRLAALERRRAELERSRAELETELASAGDISAAESASAAATAAFEAAKEAARTAEAARTTAQSDEQAARDALGKAEAAATRLAAEAGGLKDLLAGQAKGRKSAPILDRIEVEPGFEAAVGAALGDDAEAPLDDGSPVRWTDLGPLAASAELPAGLSPLSARLRGPSALDRRMSQIGVVEDPGEAARLAASLAPGQEIVTPKGGRWRWDGLVQMPGAPSPAAVRLGQRNRLAALEVDLAAARSELDRARQSHVKAKEAAELASDQERRARQAVQTCFTEAGTARDTLQRLKAALADRSNRLGALTETLERLAADRRELETERSDAATMLAQLPDGSAMRQALADARGRAAERRARLMEAEARAGSLRRDAEARATRVEALGRELSEWRRRADGAGGRVEEMGLRLEAERAELETRIARPARIAEEQAALAEQIEAAERDRKAAADALAVAEMRLGEADRLARGAEASVAAAREERVRAEAAVRAADAAVLGLRERMAERLGIEAEQLEAMAKTILGEREPPQDQAAAAALDRLLREREQMGPVNLRAELEQQELDQQITGMLRDKEDLVGAIGRLRQAIASLNREARDRLTASFTIVDGHFRRLFERLFGGGHAELKLTDAEDPLASGLEIFASPPGKRLQHLSLLSGGEQALTALALIFAVFLTNPAPICVLDEVDAPLDDANVDRFCRLIEEMARDGATRFLVITHHRMTMARVDRLYGVTMPEQGVSQLVSVDLDKAERLRATA